MTDERNRTLRERLESGEDVSPTDLSAVADIIGKAFPGIGLWEGADTGAAPTTDAVLDAIAAALPSWNIHITGQSSSVTDRWSCSIREAGVRDDDELIGVGKSKDLAHALLAAFLTVIELRDVVV